MWELAGKNLHSLQNMEMTGKYWNWLRKHEVEYYQRTGFWKQRGKIGGTARYGKGQDVMASDRKL